MADRAEVDGIGGPTIEHADVETRVATGKVLRWPEATGHLRFDVAAGAVTAEVGEARPAGLDAFWSVATTDPGSGFFYADSIRGTSETRVAYARDVAAVQELRDASVLDFTRESVGPVPVGGIVVVEHEPTRRYLAIVVDAIEPTDPQTAGAGPYALADVTWYLTPVGHADFSRASDVAAGGSEDVR